MKKRASITLTFSADLDMVKGWGDKATDWVDLIKQRLLTSDTYSPEIEVHEIIEAPYSYEEGKGYVRPKVFTMADRALVSEDLISMLDRIHQIMDTEKEARYIIPMFYEIGCLIAKARGNPGDGKRQYNRHKVALDVQDAVNLRALAREFVKVVDQASDETKSTEATWSDPAVVLFVNKLESLAHSNWNDRFSEAYKACKEKSDAGA